MLHFHAPFFPDLHSDFLETRLEFRSTISLSLSTRILYILYGRNILYIFYIFYSYILFKYFIHEEKIRKRGKSLYTLERLYKNLQTDNSDTFVDTFAILKEAAPIEKKKK